jgi:peptidase E
VPVTLGAVATRRIMATSGGLLPTERWTGPMVGRTIRRMLELARRDRPRVCVINTASGDDPAGYVRAYGALGALGCDVTHLQLFVQPNAPVREHVLAADVVWVGGGSVANLLAVWRLHGLDAVLREAYHEGVVLGGVSAGSICWHLGGPTDSYGPELRAVTDGLGLLPYGNGVHYDGEPRRRPMVHQLVRDGVFDVVYATDDRVGILYEDEVPVEVVADVAPGGPAAGAAGATLRAPAAWRVERVGGEVRETRLDPGPIRGA